MLNMRKGYLLPFWKLFMIYNLFSNSFRSWKGILKNQIVDKVLMKKENGRKKKSLRKEEEYKIKKVNRDI